MHAIQEKKNYLAVRSIRFDILTFFSVCIYVDEKHCLTPKSYQIKSNKVNLIEQFKIYKIPHTRSRSSQKLNT